MDSPIGGSPFEVNLNVVDQATVIAGTMIKNKQIKSLKKLYLLTVTTFSASNNIIFQCTTSKIPKVEECMKCRWTPLTLGSGSPCTSWTQSGDSDAIVDLLENNFILSGKIVLHGTGQSVDLANLYYGEHQDHLGHNQVTTVLSRLP